MLLSRINRLREDDRGSALIAVLALAAVTAVVAVTVGSVSVNSLRFTNIRRRRGSSRARRPASHAPSWPFGLPLVARRRQAYSRRRLLLSTASRCPTTAGPAGRSVARPTTHADPLSPRGMPIELSSQDPASRTVESWRPSTSTSRSTSRSPTSILRCTPTRSTVSCRSSSSTPPTSRSPPTCRSRPATSSAPTTRRWLAMSSSRTAAPTSRRAQSLEPSMSPRARGSTAQSRHRRRHRGREWHHRHEPDRPHRGGYTRQRERVRRRERQRAQQLRIAGARQRYGHT